MYTFKETQYGTVEVFKDGVRITTTTPQTAQSNYGYNPAGGVPPPVTGFQQTQASGGIGIGQVNTNPQPTYTAPVSNPAPSPTAVTSVPAGFRRVTTSNGAQFIVSDAGQIYSASGDLLAKSSVPDELLQYYKEPVAQQPAAPSSTQGGTTGTNSGTGTQSNDALLSILNNSNLSADQKAAIQAIYDAVSTNDQAKADQIVAAMNAASQFSEPYFKAQIQLATDALQRGLSSSEGDLSFKENQLKSALDKLKADTEAAGTNLSLQHAKELKDLQTSYETNLNDTRDALASTGFTQSSKRARAEQILNENNSGLVESSNQNYSYNAGRLTSNLASETQNTAAEIANLRRLALEGKIDLTRQAESQVGSDVLSSLGYNDILGNQPGAINTAAARDKLSFSNSFVF